MEVCAAGGEELFGNSTDIIKAFNNLPRLPLLRVASQLGVPDVVITPWSKFLASVRRRFKVRDQLSDVVMSTSGFPGGDPLSMVSMAVAGWIFHAYLGAFAPSVRSMSFVDNLSCTAASIGQLAQAHNLTHSFADLLELELDASKTFTWSTQPGHAAELELLACPSLKSARELGGIWIHRSQF